MSYSRSSYRSSKYSEGASDDSFARTTGRSSSLLDSDISSTSSLSSTRRMVRTTSYGDEGGSFSATSTARRSSRLSSIDDDDIGSSTRIRSSTVRTSRLSSRNDDDYGTTAVSSRRAYAVSGGDSFDSSRKSSLASSILGESMEGSSSRALRRLSKDDDKESFATKRSKLTSKSSYDVDESSSSVRYSSTKISSSVESSDLGAASFVASRTSYSYRDTGETGADTSAEPEISPVGGVYEAILDFKPISSYDEALPLKEGQQVEVVDASNARKWRVRTISPGDIREGWVPSCYLERKEGAVVPQISPKDEESLAKRDAVVKELVETEEDFSRDMQRVVNKYLKEMENPSMPKELRDQKDVLFSNFKDISDFHNTELIKGVQYNAGEPAKLGVTFLRLERDFDKHVKYCEDFPRAQELLASGPMKDYFDEFSKSINDDKSLSDHLKLPIQRINDYQLLLKELIKYTARLREDFGDLQRALDFMQAIPQRASDLQYINAIEGYQGNIHSWGRVMKHGWFDITDARNREQLRYLFLFKGRLCITEVKKVKANRNIYLVKGVVKTTESEIVDDGDDTTLKILQRDGSGENLPITLRAKDKEQKKEWAEELHASTIASEVVDEMLCEDVSSAEHLQEKSTYSEAESLSESTAVPLSTEPVSSPKPKLEILEGFEAYKEATSAATASVRSGSLTSIDVSRKDASGKPMFLKPLRGLTCSQGDTLSLECEVSSPETPTVQWLKDNIPLKKTAHVQPSEEFGKQKLLIKDATVEDSGMYTVLASNIQGTASCSAPVYIRPGLNVSKADSRPTSPGGTVLPHAPVFKVKLKDTELLEGTSVRFELVVRGCPEPELTFYKNGKKLKEDERVRVIFESKEVCELVIDHISFEDMGKYSCVAVNSEGKDESSGFITVTKDKILFQGLTGDFSAQGSDPLTPPPRSPAFRWFKDGQEFEASERFQVTFDDIEDTLSLVFQHVTPNDAGLYTCVASTSSGKISCSAELTVQGVVIKKAPEEPTIRASLSDVEVNEGASAMFELKVSGYPKPTIIWKHDGKTIEAGGRYRFLFEDEETMTLIIKNVTKADAGTYSVIAENEHGSANTDCKLTVNSIPAFKKELKDVSVMTDEILKLDVEVQGSPTPDVKWYKDGQAVADDDRVKIVKKDDEKHALIIDAAKVEDSGNYSCVISNSCGTQTGFSAVSVNAPPKFLQKLKDYQAAETENVTFRVKISGNPKPRVCWKKDGKLIKADGRRYQTIEEGENVHCLIIDDVTQDDVGNYTVEISNDYGSESDSASLTITCKPKIKRKFSDVECQEGEKNLKLTVEVEGSPAPKVKWELNGSEIHEDESFKFESIEEAGKFTLVIKETKSEMTGKLVCEASNPKGKDSCSGTVTVKSKPKIIKGLEDVDVQEGESAVFSVQLADGKNVNIKWSKDDCDLAIDNVKTYAREEAECTFTLLIKNVEAKDAGKYSCCVKNELGEDSSTGRMTTKSKPIFKKHLVDQEISEEEVAVFTAEVGGRPKPDVTWYHGKREIRENEVYKIAVDEETYTLKVKKPNKELEGTYTCEAQNSCGKESSSASLTIHSKPEILEGMKDIEGEIGEAVSFNVKIAGSPKPDITWKRNGEEMFAEATIKIKDQEPSYTLAFDELTLTLAGDYECVASNKYGTVCTSGKLIVNSKPKFEKRPDDVCIYSGEECTFEAKVSGVPTPEVSWFKEGDIVTEDERTTITSHNGTHRLVIKKCTRSDECCYTCTAKNSLGKVSQQAELTVKLPEDSEAPTFIRRMVDTLAVVGDKARLEVRVAGKPTPTVTWYKDDEELFESRRVTITQDGDTHTITLKDIVMTDDAKYSCKAVNEKGKAEDKAKLTVKEPVAPTIDGLKDQEGSIGSTVQFNATITGLPAPDVVWKKDGVVLTTTENVVISSDVETESYSLVIRKVGEDFGTYTCHATNSAGEADANAKLTMKGEPPVFVKKLTDAVVAKGEDVSFEARIQGHPIPTATWLVNGEVVRESDTVSISQKGECYCLKLSQVTSLTVGKVTCKAQNSAGQASSEASLSLKESAPVVEKTLPSKVKIEEGEPLKLEAKISGEPLPDVQWKKDGKPVVPSDHTKLTQKPDGTVALDIDEAKPADAGHYALVASNPQGEITAETDVEAKPKTTDDSKKPVFSEGLKDATLTEGKPGCLEAKLAKDSGPTDIQWKKDGEPVLPSGHIKLVEKPDGTVALKFDEVTPADAGHYSLIAGNEEGKISSDADVKTLPKDDESRPTFEKGLEPTTLTEGEPGTLEAKMSPPTAAPVQWTKDGKPIRPDDHIQLVEKPDGTVALQLDEVVPEDAGRYAVVASNDKGETSSEADVKTQPRSPSAQSKPRFEKGLTPTTLTEGKPARLEAKVEPGSTPLNVEWLKDGEPVKPSKHVTLEQKPDGTLALVIDKVTPEDAGHYEVVASNDKGKSASDADIKTQPEDERKPKKPIFEKGLEPTTLTEGKPARLEAKLAPESKPTDVKWLKDGRPIKANNRVQIEEKPDGTLALLIDDVRPENAGHYEVKAANDAGEASSDSDVKTQPDEYRRSKKPAFEKELESTVMPEGKPSRLEAKLSPGSNPEDVTWLKDGSPVIPSERVKLEEKPDGTLVLSINDVKPQDAGHYEVIATNKAGKAASDADVKTRPDEDRKLKKPAFEKELDSTTMPEGRPGRLEAKLAPGSKPQEIKWLKDGRPIRPSDRVKLEEKPDGTLALLIDDVRPEDAGHYKVVAANEAGEAESHGDVKTKPTRAVAAEKPEFIVELKNADLLEGQPLHLVGKVKSDTPFTVEWLKDGEKIKPSSKITLSQEPDGTVVLSIDHATPDDAGKYVCIAANPEGKTRSTGNVCVSELPKYEPKIVEELKPSVFTEGEPGKLEAKVSGEPMPDVKWVKDGQELPDDSRIRSTTSPGGDVALTIDPVKPEDAGNYSLVAANDEGECRTTVPVTVNQPPKFTAPLEPVEAVEGYPARLDTKVTGEPTPEIEWQKDGKPLSPDGEKIKEIKTPSGDVALVIPKTKPEDSGVYSCKAKNPLGENETSAPLSVAKSDTSGEPKEKPSVSPLNDANVMEGEPVTLETKVTGNPVPKVEWFFKDKPVLTSDNVQESFDGRKAKLCIKNSTPRNAGLYECRATNSSGKASASSMVDVTAMSKPRFTKPLCDLEASPSEPLQLVAKVEGHPEPEITWRYNGKDIEPSLKYNMSKVGDTCTLTVPWPQSKDSGVFECLATNPVGKDKCQARVSIRDKPDKGQPPSFLKRLENLQVPEGGKARFTARISGSPMPEVKWFKDGEELQRTPRHEMELEPSGTLRLTIRDCRPEDRGEYRASIYNPYGSDTSMGTLGVESPYDSKKRRSLGDKHPGHEVPHTTEPDLSSARSPYKSPQVNGYSPYPGGDRQREPHGAPYGRDLPPADSLPSRPPFDRPDYSPHSRHPPHPEYDDLERPYEGKYRPADKYEPYSAGVPDPLTDKPYIRRMTDHDLTLGWKPSIPSNYRVPVTYSVEMASLPDGNWTPYKSGIRDTKFDIRGLEPFKDYRFRVRVGNKHGISDPSPYVTAHRSRLGGSPPTPKDFKPKDYELEHPPLDKQGTAPYFVRREEDTMYGIHGHPVSIEFWVYGYPQPEITWTFKGKKVEMGGRYDCMQDRNGQVTLFISRMTEDNVGSYTCTAVNEHGEAMKSVHLELAEEPVFTKRLEPTTIMLRRGGELQCRVIGKPYPKIKWFKDWQPICSSGRINVIWEAPDVCTLTLNDSIARDAGLYSCSASNIAGTASCSAMLTIEEDESEFDLRTYRQPKLVKPRSAHLEEYYNLGDELGRGTQGIVYHTVERSTGRSFAAKTMHGKGQFKDWMKAELDNLNQLCHPRLIRLLDAFETKQSMSLITDLCGGGELLDNIISRDKVTENQVANYIKQILEGLNYMHSQNIGHLGLTLGDVLVTHENSDDVKIGDFALATRLPRGRTFIQEYGHPEFVAPEIANKKPANLACDMWSVGVISYILLSGISPFLGQNDRETLKNVQNGKINFLHDGFAKVSDDARDFISKLLVFDPSERLDVRAALNHPWLKVTERTDSGESLSNIDRLRDYQRKWKSWYGNASCRRHYRRRPLESCFTHPSKMIYPPDEVYTPPGSPERERDRTKVRSQFEPTTPEQANRDRLDIGTESNYQSGPDTYLLQLRDVDFPLRIRQYLRVGASRSPSLAANLRDRHWGGFEISDRGTRNTYPQVVVRERRKFVDVMDEEIDDEKKGLGTRTLPLRLQREVGSLGYAHHQLEHLKHEAWKDQESRERAIGRAPFFREKIEDCVIRENDDVVFKCLAVGNPPPQYTWFRNDSLLIESSRVQIKQDSEGRSELQLKPGRAYDVGVFKCAARNSHGVALCHARLKIGDRPSRPESPVCKQCTSHQVYIEWSSPKFEGNSRTISFCLEMKETGAAEWTKLSDIITQEFWVASDLKASTSYTFRVSAKNQYGWSEPSIPSDPCTTESGGSSSRIQLSHDHQYQQIVSGSELVDHKDDKASPDYGLESTGVQLETDDLRDLYNFDSEISVGRFGVVVSGSSKKLGCNLVLKLILTGADNESTVRREYEILKTLRHERIVCLKTASLHDDLLVLGLEKLSGLDVLTYLTLRRQYNEDMVARIVKQVFDGLEYLHFRSICYIELQPDNVVMSDAHGCNIKLVDFGSADFVSRTGTVIRVDENANTEYLAPEVLRGQEVSHATDVWGVGVLTYILLSGYSPFLGTDKEDTKSNVIYVRYHFDKLYREASTEATRFIMQLFKRTPEKRPTISECLENKWMLPSEFMLRKRENSVFLSHKLQEFATEFHTKRRNAGTAEKLSNLIGLSFSRSHASSADVTTD